MEACPFSYFLWWGYFWGSWMSFVVTDEFSVRVTKITSRIGVSWTHSLTFCFWPIFNSWTLDVYQINLNHTTLYNLALPIFEVFDGILLNMNLSSNQTVVTFLFYGRQTWMRGYLPLTWKDSVAHMRGLAVCVKEGLLFAWGLSLNKSADSYVFNCLYFSVLFFFINDLFRLYARFLMPFCLT